MRELPYRNLEAWQIAMEFAQEMLSLCREPNLRDDRVIRDQLARAATSIAANLAEGHGRGTWRDFAAFVDRARGSLFEVDTWLELLKRDGRLAPERAARYSERVLRLNAVRYRLRASARERAESSNTRT